MCVIILLYHISSYLLIICFFFQNWMYGNSFVSALFYALIGLDTFITRPISVTASSHQSTEFLSTTSLTSSSSSAVAAAAPSSSSSSSSGSSATSSLSSLAALALAHNNDVQQQLINKNKINNSDGGSNIGNRIDNIATGSGADAFNGRDMKFKQACKISEWKCLNETCISLSKFCDGSADCLDKSDEPNQCSSEYGFFAGSFICSFFLFPFNSTYLVTRYLHSIIKCVVMLRVKVRERKSVRYPTAVHCCQWEKSASVLWNIYADLNFQNGI